MPPPLLALSASSRLRRKLRMVAEAGPVSPIVGPVAFARSWSGLAELAAAHPASPTVVDAAFPEGSPSPATFATAPRIGASDSLGVIRHAVLGAIDPERPRRLLARIREQGATEAGRIMDHVLTRSFGPCTVPDLAASLGLSHWSLLRRCAALGIPTPKKLTDLGRVYTVERLAEWSEQPSGVAGTAVGYPEPANYRRTARRALGDPPTAIRRSGGAAYVGRVILRRLAPTTTGPVGLAQRSAKN